MRAMTMTRWLVAAVAVTMSGCTACSPAEECDNVFITFEAPIDGSTQSSPLDVAVTVTDRGGNPVTLDSATIATRLSSAAEFSAPTPGAIETGRATFGSVPLTQGNDVIRVSVQKANSTCSPVSKNISVTIQDTSAPPEVTAFTFEGDGNMDGTLNSAELPVAFAAINAQLTLSRAAGCDVSIKYQATEVGKLQNVTTGQVSVSMASTNFPNRDGTAPYPLFAQVTCPDGRKNDAIGNPVAAKSLLIDIDAPTCALLSPSRTLYGPADDDDAVATGYQVRTLGQAGPGATQMQLKLTGGLAPQATGFQSAAGGTLANDFTIIAAGTTQYSVVLEVVDSAGNLCTVAKQVGADFEAPGVTITAPTAGNQTSYNLPVTLAVVGGDGSSVVVTTTPNGGSAQAVCGGTVAAGAFTCNGSFVAGLQTVTVRVTDQAGNTTTQMVIITVNAPGCQVAFTKPASNPKVLTPLDDLQVGVADLQYQFIASSPTAGCGNKVTRLLRNGTLVDTGTTNGSGVYTSPFQTEPNSGGLTITYRVEVDDGLGNTTFAVVGVIVNLNVPIITVPTNNTGLNTERDLDNATAGVQAQLSYTPAPPTGYKGVLCSTVQFGAGAACPDGQGGFIMPGGDGIPVSNASFSFPDGVYGIRMIFKELAGTQTVSDPAAINNLTVESVRPVVTSFTFQGDANSDKRLNVAEQASGAPVAVLAISGANGGTVLVRNRVTGLPVSAAIAVTAGAASVPLSTLGASGSTFEGDFTDLVAEVLTAAGSKNMVTTPPPSGATLNTAAFTTLRVDRAPPTCALTQPGAPQLGISDDADGVAAGYQVRVAGTTVADVGTNGVSFELVPTAGAGQTQVVTPAANAAAYNFTVPSSGEVTYEARCTATDLSGNVGTRVVRSVLVDLVAPSCTLVTPNAAASPYTTSYSIATQATITNGGGAIPKVFSKLGAAAEVQVGQLLTVAGNSYSGTISYFSGTQTVRVEVTDAAGNACADAAASQVITLNVPGCSLVWTAPASNPANLLKANDSQAGSPTTVEYTLTGTSSCLNQQMHFYRGAVLPANELGGSPINTSGAGAFSFPISLPDSDGVTAETITATLDNGVTTTSFPLTLYVDLTLPVVNSTTPSGANLYVVSPSNSRIGQAGYVVDIDTGTAGGKFTATANVSGAQGGEFSVRYQGATVAGPVTIGASPPSLDVNLPHNSTGTLDLRVTDAAGNIVDTSSTVAVDVIPPGPVTVACNLVAGKEREARVNVTWGSVATYDDGTDSASGAVTKFDVRWTSEAVLAGGLTGSADYFDSLKAWPDQQVDPPATSQQMLVPPLVGTYCYVRARDELYNYSAFPSVLPTMVANPGAFYSFANPHPSAAAAQEFGRFLAAKGSLNNDGLDDLAVGYGYFNATGNPEKAYVYYGSTTTFGTAAPQEILAPDGLAGGFGADVAMGNVGDAVTGDNKSDLIVASPYAGTGLGRVYVFFGSTSAAQISTALSNTVIFVGGAGSFLGLSAQVVGDINGDGYSELMLAAPQENSLKGRIYMFYGRSIAAWTTLSGGTLGTPIPLSAADRVFNGPTPLASSTNDFGRVRGGFTNIGTDVAFPASRTTVASLFIFDGAGLNAAAAGTSYTTGYAPGTPNQALQTLVGQVGGSGTREGFGSRAIANLDLVATGNPDLVVTEPFYRKVHIFADRQAGMFLAAPTTTITGPTAALRFGNDAVAVDFTRDGKPDLFVGDAIAGGYTWVLPNRGLAGSEFETNPGSSGGFWYGRLGGTKIGTGLASGDFDGDGKPDVAISDVSDVNGKVLVWH